ncbi:MAG: hypothetical protein IIT65_09855 [Lachnospiraceae bacterium]|nr:hypothetical protein [Lachnospiraceae bacterium]
MKTNKKLNNRQFVDSALVNDRTYWDYLDRFKKIAMSIFEWVNLPDTMNERYLETCLFYNGAAAMFKDDEYGFINTNVAMSGDINIYGLPTRLNCYSYGNFTKEKMLYSGLETATNNDAILVLNNWEKVPTAQTLELFALRLYEAERACDTNIKAMKTPVLLLGSDKQKLMLTNLYNQYDGNQPVIYGDKNGLEVDSIKCIKTDAPFVADKIMDYKKEIWNEALTFLGINNIMLEKKERLVSDEANSNNELINLNLQSYLIPRMEACKQFNRLYGLEGTDKEISVRVRSDLRNIIKTEMSSVKDFTPDSENIESEVEVDG